jgi:hypothetical protein
MTAMVGKRLCQIKVPRLDAYPPTARVTSLSIELGKSGMCNLPDVHDEQRRLDANVSPLVTKSVKKGPQARASKPEHEVKSSAVPSIEEDRTVGATDRCRPLSGIKSRQEPVMNERWLEINWVASKTTLTAGRERCTPGAHQASSSPATLEVARSIICSDSSRT